MIIISYVMMTFCEVNHIGIVMQGKKHYIIYKNHIFVQIYDLSRELVLLEYVQSKTPSLRNILKRACSNSVDAMLLISVKSFYIIGTWHGVRYYCLHSKEYIFHPSKNATAHNI